MTIVLPVDPAGAQTVAAASSRVRPKLVPPNLTVPEQQRQDRLFNWSVLMTWSQSDKYDREIDMGDRYGRSIWEIYMGHRYGTSDINEISIWSSTISIRSSWISIWEMRLLIWEMTVSIWSSPISIWDILSLCLFGVTADGNIEGPLRGVAAQVEF